MSFTRFTTRTLATLTLWAGLGVSAFAQLPNLTIAYFILLCQTKI